MLKAMGQEIQAILGDEYGLFNEFNPQSLYSDELLERYKHIGVLYLDNGNPNFVPDCASMTLYYTLVLYMRIPEGQKTSDMTVQPLEKLNSEMTGKLYAENAEWKYVLNIGLPTSDGTLQAGGNVQFMVYNVPITAIVASGVLLTDNTKIKLSFTSGASGFLKGVITCTEVPIIQTESAAFFPQGNVSNATGEVESLVVGRGWGLQISKLYNPDDAVDVAIRKEARHPSANKITVSYAMGDEQPEIHYCIISEATFSNEKGQAVIMTFTLTDGMRSTM